MQKGMVVVLAFCAVLSACGGSSTDEASEASTELQAETTLDAPTPVAEVDFDTLYRELDAVREQAYAKNDPDILAEASGNKQAIADLQRRVDAGESTTKSDDHNYTIDAVSVFQVVNEDRVTLRVTDTVVGETIKLDAEGNEVDRWSRETPTRTYIVVLNRVDNNDWRIDLDHEVSNDLPASAEA